MPLRLSERESFYYYRESKKHKHTTHTTHTHHFRFSSVTSGFFYFVVVIWPSLCSSIKADAAFFMLEIKACSQQLHLRNRTEQKRRKEGHQGAGVRSLLGHVDTAWFM